MKFTLLLTALAGLTWATAVGQEDSSRPEWIWVPGDRVPAGQAVVFETHADAPEPTDTVRIRGATDFCRVTLSLDGEPLLSVNSDAPLFEREIRRPLPRGRHTLTLHCNSVAGPSAAAFRIELLARGSVVTTALTSSDWVATQSEHRDGTMVESFGSIHRDLWGMGHRPVRVSAFDDYEQWRDALTSSGETLSPTFLLPDNFRIQTLRSAEDNEGSWVSMEFDPQGRLIIAREDAGLLRMTLADANDSVISVETINDSLEECRGLVFSDGDLLVNANNSKAMFRLRDTDDDDQFDDVTELRTFPGNVGHGRNDLALDLDGRVLSIHGDAVDLPTERIVDRTSPLRVARPAENSREGSLLRTTNDGLTWELICAGMRNPFGVAVHPEFNDAFTYDADAEHDMGAPWYRPTRVLQLVSGADFGWRGVTGQWPPYFPDHIDNAMPLLDIGKGSPTAVKFGTNSRFPQRFRTALYILDWAYGRIIAVHLFPHGAGYRAQKELFARGLPLNVTDLDFGPDGAMYVVTGGRKTQSALYRISYTGPQQEASPRTAQQVASEQWSEQMRSLRARLERFHGRTDSEAVPTAWQWFGHSDPQIRYAARIAIEHQPVDEWRDLVRDLPEPQSSTEYWRTVNALLMLARTRNPEHQAHIPGKLNRLDVGLLSEQQLLTVLRTYDICLEDHEQLDPELVSTCQHRLEAFHTAATVDSVLPTGSGGGVSHMLCRLLVRLKSSVAVPRTMGLLTSEQPHSQRLEYLFWLREAETGWTIPLRRAYFVTLQAMSSEEGGHGYPGFLQSIRKDAIATLTKAERLALADILEPPADTEDAEAPLPQRPFVRKWTHEELLAVVPNLAAPRDFERGRLMFRAASCSRCHRVGTEGSSFGPDLTAVGSRFRPADILHSILKPSAVVAEPYRTHQILTKQGRVISGQVLSGGDYRARDLQVVPDPLFPARTVSIPKQEIESFQESNISPMPEGLLNTLSEREILDLLAFLVSGGREQ